MARDAYREPMPESADKPPLDAILQKVLEAVPFQLTTEGGPEAARARFRDLPRHPVHQELRAEDRTVDGPGGPIPIRLYWPPEADAGPVPVVMFFHGGGWVVGGIETHDGLCRQLANKAQAVVVSVDYRLAPEHPFPAAMEDALTAWHFLRQQGIAARHIAIGGDSAGGGLTVVLNNRLRDADEELPGCVWLVSPWTDLTMSGSTLITKDNVDPIIHKGYLGELADAYVPLGMGRKDPRVSPLYADLKGLPPMLVQVGSAETLLEDATRFAAAAGAADVSVTLEIWPHMVHAWPMWNAGLKPGRSALAHAGAFMRAHL